MKVEQGYQGHANYETWAVALWLSNDEATYRYWKEAAEESRAEAALCRQVRDGVWTANKAPLYLLAARLEEELSEGAPSLGANVYADLLNSAISEIDWQEIAEQFIEEDSPDGKPEANRKFPLGQVVATSAASATLDKRDIDKALARHTSGDWGECGPEDAEENELSLREGFRLFSVYDSENGKRFWVITEADRSSTTVLLPEDY